jgi:Tol biopolymer transport system component
MTRTGGRSPRVHGMPSYSTRMGRRGIVTCAALFACMCAPAEAQLVYSADGRLYEIAADGSDRGLLTAPPSPKGTDAEPAWSPDGAQVAVVHERNGVDDFYRSRIDLLSSDGSNRQSVTDLQSKTWVSSPQWSPDGSGLAFTRFTRRSGRYTSSIVVRDLGAAGAEHVVIRQRLDRRLSSVWRPEWSPDGESLLYSASWLDRHAYFRSSVYTVPADGGQPALFMGGAHSATFSPDGSRIAYVSIADRNGSTCGSDECSYNGELYVRDADGGSKLRLTRSKGDDMGPDWSPDGTRIAFASNRNFPDGTGHELYSIEPDGSCLTWLTNGTADSVDPDWSPTSSTSEPGGCGATSRPPLVEVDLAPAFAYDSVRPLWLGLTHRGLLLSDLDAEQPPLFFGYLDCGRFRPRDCPPGIQVLVQSVCSPDAGVGFLGGRIDRRRRALVQDFGIFGLMALTGGAEVHVSPEVDRAAPARAAFRALRPFPRERNVEQLRPPAIPAALARQIERVVRLHRRLGSVAAVAERMSIRHETVRQRLANAKALDDFRHRVRTTRC